MGKYLVEITQKRIVTVEVEVEAPSGEEAEHIARNAFDETKGTMPEEWIDPTGKVHTLDITFEDADWEYAEAEITAGSHQD
jgi:hypothetical protein